MIDSAAPQVVRNYLTQLDTELAGVPETVARDIRAGVAEELAGMDAATAAARIEQLGDPAFIAAEARAESAAPSEPTATAATEGSASGGAGVKPQPRESLWYVVLATLLIAFVPLAGWAAGLVMVWASAVWRRAEKVTAVVISVVLVILPVAALWIAARLAPAAADDVNPLLPAAYDIAWTVGVLVPVLFVGLAVWLLAVGLRRTRRQ